MCRSELTLPARLGRQDKSNGVMGCLSRCLHIQDLAILLTAMPPTTPMPRRSHSLCLLPRGPASYDLGASLMHDEIDLHRRGSCFDLLDGNLERLEQGAEFAWPALDSRYRVAGDTPQRGAAATGAVGIPNGFPRTAGLRSRQQQDAFGRRPAGGCSITETSVQSRSRLSRSSYPVDDQDTLSVG